MASVDVVSVSLYSLPQELVAEVLQDLPNLTDVRSAVVASKTFYNAFRRQAPAIISTILSTQLPGEIRQVIHAVAAVWQVKPFPTGVQQFCGKHLNGREIRPLATTAKPLMFLARLTKLVETVDNVTGHFIEQTLYNPRKPHLSHQLEGPTEIELHRIRRAMWRYQLCCEIFPTRTEMKNFEQAQDDAEKARRRAAGEPEEEQAFMWYDKEPKTCPEHRQAQEAFLRCFTVWESEELQCIHDYLTAFAEELHQKLHNKDPGLFVRYNPYRDIPAKDNASFVSWSTSSLPKKGFHFVKKLIKTNDNKFQAALQKSADDFLCGGFMQDVLKRLKYTANTEWGQEAAYLHRDEFWHKLATYWPDSPEGTDAANAGFTYFNNLGRVTTRLSYPATYARLNRWAYCMWEEERLKEWKVRNKHHEDDDYMATLDYCWRKDIDPDGCENFQDVKAMLRSWW